MAKAASNSFTGQVLKTLLFLGIGFFILYLVYYQQNSSYQAQCALDGIADEDCNLIKKVWTDFKSVKFFWLILVMIAFILSNLSRALRWKMLLKPLGYNATTTNAFFANMIGYFANLALPRMGEFVKVGTLSKYEKIPFEKVMGTIVVDRVMDVICLLIMIGVALIVDYDLLWGQISAGLAVKDNSSIVYWFWVFVAVVTGISFALWLMRERIKKRTLYDKVREKVLGFIDGLKSIGKLESPLLFIAHSAFIWLMFYLMMYLAFQSFEPVAHLNPSAALMVFIFGSLGMVIPSPGGMGTFHFLTILALSIYGISSADSFSFANIVFFAVQIFSAVLFGIIGLVLLPLTNKQSEPKPIETTL